MRRTLKLTAAVLCALVLFAGCSKKDEAEQPKSYIGDVVYGGEVCAYVMENIEGESEKGLISREVVDLNGLLSQEGNSVCLFFYNGAVTDTNGLTAGVEDLAQCLDGSLMIVAIDGTARTDLVAAFEVQMFPEFVLFENGAKVSYFDGMNYDYWTMDDVVMWLEQYGYTPDYSKLE